MNSYFAAMAARTPEAAEISLANLVDLALDQDPLLSPQRAREIQLINIGYCTGYLGDRAEQRRVLELYQTEHPIFGKFEEDITPEKAFQAGLALAQMAKPDGHLTAEALAAAREIIRQP